MGFKVGESIGAYQIVEYIGQGGMATIYRAYQPALDRFVAIKVIHPALKEDASFVKRLKREAAIIARMNHPNIVTVHDFTEYEGLPFLVLRFIDGKTLRMVMQEQKLSTHQILNIIRPVADALAYAHAHNVLHRDVKPSNILIDNEGRVYLTDFGLARFTHATESTSSQDMLIGSPHYISPEQAKSEEIGVTTDIYSLGIVLYEMFTGRVPFSADTPYGMILAQINDPPPPPRSLNPKIPPAVEQVLLKALEKEPAHRYPSIRAMMRALENAVRGPHEREEDAAIPLLEYKPGRDALWQDSVERISNQFKTATNSFGGESPKRRAWLPVAIGALAFVLIFVILAAILGSILNPFGKPTPALSVITTPTTLARRPTFGATILSGSTIVPTNAPIIVASPTTAAPPPPTQPPPTATHPPSTPTAVVLPPTRAPAAPASDSPRGKIAYSVATGDAAELHSIWLADADGSNAHPIIEFGMWPSISPDGTKIAYYRIKDSGLWVANIDGSNSKRIVGGEISCIQWSPDGKKIMYFQGKLKIGDGKIMIANADGTAPTETVPGYNPAWAPDGNRFVYSNCQINSSQCGLFVYDLRTHGGGMITTDNGGAPQWSPRGDKIAYQASGGKGNVNVFTANPDGSGKKQITFGKGNDGQPAWTDDGNFIVYRSDQDGKAWGIFAIRPDGTNARLLINNVPPDANWWARESLATGP